MRKTVWRLKLEALVHWSFQFMLLELSVFRILTSFKVHCKLYSFGVFAYTFHPKIWSFNRRRLLPRRVRRLSVCCRVLGIPGSPDHPLLILVVLSPSPVDGIGGRVAVWLGEALLSLCPSDFFLELLPLHVPHHFRGSFCGHGGCHHCVKLVDGRFHGLGSCVEGRWSWVGLW